MNPELQRNLWLEFTPRRAIAMAGSLGLVFLVADSTFGLRSLAEFLFYFIAVIWGARNAAQTVVGEIRDRTWDLQRLSSLTPFAMTWGKLLGATSYTWFGGALCLAVLVVTAYRSGGAAVAFADLCYFIAVGLTAQSVALFASLLGVRRRQTHSRLDVFLYQATGLIAAWGVWSVWQTIASGGTLLGVAVEVVHWWGQPIDAAIFYLASLAAFLVWTVAGCYRLMRLELRVHNTPVVWTGFIFFIAVYVAGLGGANGISIAGVEFAVALPLFLASFALAGLTYAAVFFEPKDHVLYRWLVQTLLQKNYGALMLRLPAWLIAYAAALAVALSLAAYLAVAGADLPGFVPLHASSVVAAAGFLTRDLAIFLVFPLMPGRSRGELSAIIALAMVYLVLPTLLGGFGANWLFYPDVINPTQLGATVPWVQATALWYAVFHLGRRIMLDPAPQPLSSTQPARK